MTTEPNDTSGLPASNKEETAATSPAITPPKTNDKQWAAIELLLNEDFTEVAGAMGEFIQNPANRDINWYIFSAEMQANLLTAEKAKTSLEKILNDASLLKPGQGALVQRLTDEAKTVPVELNNGETIPLENLLVSLDKFVREGKAWEEFYYQLNVFSEKNPKNFSTFKVGGEVENHIKNLKQKYEEKFTGEADKLFAQFEQDFRQFQQLLTEIDKINALDKSNENANALSHGMQILNLLEKGGYKTPMDLMNSFTQLTTQLQQKDPTLLQTPEYVTLRDYPIKGVQWIPQFELFSKGLPATNDAVKQQVTDFQEKAKAIALTTNTYQRTLEELKTLPPLTGGRFSRGRMGTVATKLRNENETSTPQLNQKIQHFAGQLIELSRTSVVNESTQKAFMAAYNELLQLLNQKLDGKINDEDIKKITHITLTYITAMEHIVNMDSVVINQRPTTQELLHKLDTRLKEKNIQISAKNEQRIKEILAAPKLNESASITKTETTAPSVTQTEEDIKFQALRNPGENLQFGPTITPDAASTPVSTPATPTTTPFQPFLQSNLSDDDQLITPTSPTKFATLQSNLSMADELIIPTATPIPTTEKIIPAAIPAEIQPIIQPANIKTNETPDTTQNPTSSKFSFKEHNALSKYFDDHKKNTLLEGGGLTKLSRKNTLLGKVAKSLSGNGETTPTTIQLNAMAADLADTMSIYLTSAELAPKPFQDLSLYKPVFDGHHCLALFTQKINGKLARDTLTEQEQQDMQKLIEFGEKIITALSVLTSQSPYHSEEVKNFQTAAEQFKLKSPEVTPSASSPTAELLAKPSRMTLNPNLDKLSYKALSELEQAINQEINQTKHHCHALTRAIDIEKNAAQLSALKTSRQEWQTKLTHLEEYQQKIQAQKDLHKKNLKGSLAAHRQAIAAPVPEKTLTLSTQHSVALPETQTKEAHLEILAEKAAKIIQVSINEKSFVKFDEKAENTADTKAKIIVAPQEVKCEFNDLTELEKPQLEALQDQVIRKVVELAIDTLQPKPTSVSELTFSGDSELQERAKAIATALLKPRVDNKNSSTHALNPPRKDPP